MISVLVRGGTMSLALMMAPAPGGAQNPLAAVLPVALIFVVFYFLILRPQQKQRKEHRAMLDALKAGDPVVTIGGIHGTVVAVDELNQTVVVRVSDNVRVTFNRTAIAGRIQPKE
jgi:preprotein translocase subunit YajC